MDKPCLEDWNIWTFLFSYSLLNPVMSYWLYDMHFPFHVQIFHIVFWGLLCSCNQDHYCFKCSANCNTVCKHSTFYSISAASFSFSWVTIKSYGLFTILRLQKAENKQTGAASPQTMTQSFSRGTEGRGELSLWRVSFGKMLYNVGFIGQRCQLRNTNINTWFSPVLLTAPLIFNPSRFTWVSLPLVLLCSELSECVPLPAGLSYVAKRPCYFLLYSQNALWFISRP